MSTPLVSISENEPLSSGLKRSASDDIDSSSKKSKKSSFDPELLKALNSAKSGVDRIRRFISNKLLPEPEDLFQWEVVVNMWRKTFQKTENRESPDLSTLAKKLPNFQQGTLEDVEVDIIQRIVKNAYTALENLSAVYTAHQKARPSPSFYAHEWAEPQGTV